MAESFERWIKREIRSFVKKDPGNRLERLDGSPIFEAPLVGFVAGDDPIFQQLKQVIGEFHLSPPEALALAAKRRGAATPPASEIGVVAYVLPISKATRQENKRMKDRPSARWAHTRLFGEQFNGKLQTHLVSLLERHGRLAIAPEREEDLFRILRDESVGLASAWSQRHVAFSAGLGTFGLSDGLITAAGKAHRVGSVVVDTPLESPERPDEIHRDCLAHRGFECRSCGKRCPADAISPDGHDKDRCGQFVFSQIPMIKRDYEIDIYACGLCQTGVPCEGSIPRPTGRPSRD